MTKTKGKIKEIKETETEEMIESPLEAFECVPTKLDPDDAYSVIGCDGEQTYVWLVHRRKGAKRFSITETYPGLTKRKTDLRSATEAKDLKLSSCDNIEDACTLLNETMFEGFEVCSAETEPASENQTATQQLFAASTNASGVGN